MAQIPVLPVRLLVRGAEGRMSGVDARLAAADLLTLTLDSRRTLDEAMVQSVAFDGLVGADRGFARAMASATLRELGRLDAALLRLASRPLDKMSPSIRALARIGLAQLWLMGTEPHAAVNATVSAAKALPDAVAGSGFLNAVLRRATREPVDFDTVSPITIWPEWLQAQFMQDLGQSGAMTLARSQLREPKLHLTAKGDAQAVADALSGTLIPPGSIQLETGTVEDLAGYEAGDWWVQDAAASLPARLLDVQSGDVVLDLCAAPGGKTLQLAAAGGHVFAVDRSAARLKRLNENVTRVGLEAQVTALAEKTEDWRPDAPVAKILLDAPCSALGTLRRHPEGAWIKTAKDIARFPDVQARMLRAAGEMLATSGTLIYCVCTPLRTEGSDVIDLIESEGVLSRMPLSASDVLGFEGSLTAKGDLLTLPLQGADHDAFFIARLTKS